MKFSIIVVFLIISFSGFSQEQRIEEFRDSLYEAARKSNAEPVFQKYTDSLYQVLNARSMILSVHW